MSVDRNKTTARRFSGDGWNRRDFAVFDEVLAPDLGVSRQLRGPAWCRRGAGAARPSISAFPDYHVTIEELIAEGEKVVVRYTAHGSHAGVFLGWPPTGRTIAYEGIDIRRFVDGRIVERRNLPRPPEFAPAGRHHAAALAVSGWAQPN